MNLYHKIKKIIKNFLKKSFFPIKSSLVKIIKKEKNVDKGLKKLIESKKGAFWISKLEITIVVISFLFFVSISHLQTVFPIEEFIKVFSKFIVLKDGNHYQNLITIHAGIGAVLIALAFFVAQEITKEKESPYKGLILLKRSKFFPLLIAEVLFFFQFAWGSVNALSVIPIFFIGITTIYSLYQTIGLMADNFYLKKEEDKEFLKAIRKSFLKILDFEVTQILGNERISKTIKQKDNIIRFTPFPPLDKKKYVQIKSQTHGLFADINFGKLAKFLTELQNLLPEDEVISEDITDTKNIEIETTEEPYCYLTPRLYSNLKEFDNTLFWIKKDILEKEDDLKRLTVLAQKVFKIKESVKFDPEETRNQILKVKVRSLKAIKDGKTDELNRTISIYTNLIEDFYKYLEPFGGGFSEKQAKDMRTEIFFGSFRFIDWLSKDIKEIFEQGIQSKNINIIKEVAYLPIILVHYAIDHKDHLIFQEFSYYQNWLYKHALTYKRVGNEELAGFMFDRTWRYLRELSDYYLGPKLKEEDYPEDEFKNFAIGILKIFQNLLKTSLEKGDIINFGKFLSVTSGLFKNLDNIYKKSNDDKNIFCFLNNKREQMFFGLASWIIFLLEGDKNNIRLKKFYNEVSSELTLNIEELTKIFIHSHDFETQDFWGWDNWEMEERREGEVHCIQILEKLEKFYAIKSLILISGKSKEEIKKIQLPPSRDLADLAEGTRDLIKTLDDIKNNPEKWQFILSDSAIQKVDAFKGLLGKAKQGQEKKEIEFKKGNPISAKKVEEFKEKVLKNFYEHSTIRDIFTNYLKNYQNKTKEKWEGDISRFGINAVDNKATFFDKWHIFYSGWGDSHGESLAYGENVYLIDELSKKCNEINIEDFEEKLKTINDLGNVVILITDNLVLWDKGFQRVAKLIPEYQSTSRLDTNGFVGWCQFNDIKIPIFETFYRAKLRRKDVFILNKSRLGTLVQYSPLNDGEDKVLLEDIFYMDIRSFSEDEELMKEFIERKTPQWLKEVGDKEEQKEYLRERVLINVFERFKLEFVEAEKFEGYKICLGHRFMNE